MTSTSACEAMDEADLCRRVAEVVGGAALAGDRCAAQHAFAGVEVEVGVDRPGRWECGLGAIDSVHMPRVEDGRPDRWSRLPAAFDIAEVAVEEAPKVRDIAGLVGVGPLVGVVDAKPFGAAQVGPRAQRAGSVHLVAVGGHDVGRRVDA
jgi:hypothetical protein